MINMKETAHFYNGEGNWVPHRDIIVSPNENGDYDLPDGYTLKPVPQPNWKPVFDEELDDWVETITKEELEELENPPKRKTEMDILKEENISLQLALAELASEMEKNKLEMQLAIAEVGAMLGGGQ